MIIVLMLVKLFNMACDISKPTDKVEQLAQELAPHEKENEDQGLHEKENEDQVGLKVGASRGAVVVAQMQKHLSRIVCRSVLMRASRYRDSPSRSLSRSGMPSSPDTPS